jgi:O-antigen/teichoic acid export membrane protein
MVPRHNLSQSVGDLAKNLYYSLSSNFLSLLISTLVILVVPKFIGVKEYGYWQLYLFYSSYVGFLHFGWNDGIYLKYGGKNYDDLNKALLFSQFIMLLLFQAAFGIIFYLWAPFMTDNSDRIFIIKATSICILFTNITLTLNYILQSTYKIKEYAHITIIGKVFYFVLMMSLILAGKHQYKTMIMADLSGKFITFGIAAYYCKDIVFRQITSFYFTFQETVENISIGIKLMLANIASMLIIGSIRFGIERAWDIETFGKLSLALSTSFLLMIFLNAAGVVLFPFLRRLNPERLPQIYTGLRNILLMLLLTSMLLYYPLSHLLEIWLPKYAESIVFLSILFPLFIFEGKVALLANVYLKTLRKEKEMLIINIISLIFSLTLTVISTIVLRNLSFAVFSIILSLAFRAIISELYLSKLLKIPLLIDIVLETILIAFFVISVWLWSLPMAMISYIVLLVIYFLYKRKKLTSQYQKIRLEILQR